MTPTIDLSLRHFQTQSGDIALIEVAGLNREVAALWEIVYALQDDMADLTGGDA